MKTTSWFSAALDSFFTFVQVQAQQATGGAGALSGSSIPQDYLAAAEAAATWAAITNVVVPGMNQPRVSSAWSGPPPPSPGWVLSADGMFVASNAPQIGPRSCRDLTKIYRLPGTSIGD